MLNKKILLYFELHHAARLATVGDDHKSDYFIDDHATGVEFSNLCHDVYQPVNEMLLRAISANPGLGISIAVSGQIMEQFSRFAPEVIESLRRLNDTGSVEWLAVPYNNSLSALVSEDVYREELVRQSEMLHKYFHVLPGVLLTSPCYHTAIPRTASAMGFKAVLINSVSATARVWGRDERYDTAFISTDSTLPQMLARHYDADEAALSVSGFIEKLNPASGGTVVIGCRYESFFENRLAGFLQFFEQLMGVCAANLYTPTALLQTSSETLARMDSLTLPQVDLFLWQGNELQKEALAAVSLLEEATRHVVDETLRERWRMLLTADYFREMSSDDGPLGGSYISPQEAYGNYKRILESFKSCLADAPVISGDEPSKSVESDRRHPSTPAWALQEQSRYKQVIPSHL